MKNDFLISCRVDKETKIEIDKYISRRRMLRSDFLRMAIDDLLMKNVKSENMIETALLKQGVIIERLENMMITNAELISKGVEYILAHLPEIPEEFLSEAKKNSRKVHGWYIKAVEIALAEGSILSKLALGMVERQGEEMVNEK